MAKVAGPAPDQATRKALAAAGTFGLPTEYEPLATQSKNHE